MALDQRRDEVRRVIAASESWGRKERSIRGVALVGSWSRQAGRLDSDLDLIVLASEPRALLTTNEWHREFGIVKAIGATGRAIAGVVVIGLGLATVVRALRAARSGAATSDGHTAADAARTGRAGPRPARGGP